MDVQQQYTFRQRTHSMNNVPALTPKMPVRHTRRDSCPQTRLQYSYSQRKEIPPQHKNERHPRHQRIRKGIHFPSFDSHRKRDLRNDLASVLNGQLSHVMGPGDRYILYDRVGQGVFANVICAWDTKKHRYVALKVFHRDAPFQAQGFREQATLRYLEHIKTQYNESNHRHIVPTYDIFRSMDRLCIAFPLYNLDMRNFLHLEKSSFGFCLSMVQRFAHQLLQSLQFLRYPSVDIVHGDMKPENIMLTSSESSVNCHVIDFGNAYFRSSAIPWLEMQTLWYRSPECLLSLPWDQSIDVWSLGCILYELHTARPLFPSHTERELTARIEALLGPFPKHMVQRSPFQFRLFHRDTLSGNYVSRIRYQARHRHLLQRWAMPLRQRLKVNEGGGLDTHLHKDIREPAYELFIHFLHCMLRYDPRDRWTPGELLDHPFLQFCFAVL